MFINIEKGQVFKGETPKCVHMKLRGNSFLEGLAIVYAFKQNMAIYQVRLFLNRHLGYLFFFDMLRIVNNRVKWLYIDNIDKYFVY